jgi:hypothetical protein
MPKYEVAGTGAWRHRASIYRITATILHRYRVPYDAAAFDSRRTPRDVLRTNRPHGTQSQSVSEPSSRGTTPSPRAHVRCVAARAPGPTEHALGPEGGHTHGRRRRTARVVLSSARQGRAAHPGAATTAVGPTSLGACGHTSGIRHLLCGVQASGSPQGSGP